MEMGRGQTESGCSTRAQIVSFLSSKRVWLALAAATSYSPQLPSDVSSSHPVHPSATRPHDTKRGGGGKRPPPLADDKKTGFLTPSADVAALHSSDLAQGVGVGSSSSPSLSVPAAHAAMSGASVREGEGGGGSGGHASREALSGCALGLLYELACSLEGDVRALLFWERFWVLYFTALKLEVCAYLPLSTPRFG